MRKLMILIGGIASASTAYANVAETKAQNAVKTKVDAAMAEIKTACGNAELTGEIAWADYDAVKLEQGKTKDVVEAYAGDYMTAVAHKVKSLCADKDYKVEMAKITKIVGHPGETGDGSFMQFAKTGNTIDVHFAKGNPANAEKDLKKLF